MATVKTLSDLFKETYSGYFTPRKTLYMWLNVGEPSVFESANYLLSRIKK